MRTREVVALDSITSAVNVPGQFVIAADDRDGLLHQRSGEDVLVSDTLLAIIKDLHTLQEQL